MENYYIDLKCENSQINRIINRNDVVSFFNVLEHMEDPKRFIDYIYNNMHDNAVMVFEVPRHPSIASFANMTYCNIIYRHITSPGHLQVFSEKSIAMLLQDKLNDLSNTIQPIFDEEGLADQILVVAIKTCT